MSRPEKADTIIPPNTSKTLVDVIGNIAILLWSTEIKMIENYVNSLSREEGQSST